MNLDRSTGSDSLGSVTWENQEAGTGSVVTGPSSARSTASSPSSFCHLCGYESGRHSNLKRHMKTMHEPASSKSFHCCDITFQDKATYRDHCRQTHREGHACSTCGRRFSRRALLRRHQSVHTGFKEFKCHVCSYGSSHKSNLERHLRTHSAFSSAPTLQPVSRRYRKPVKKQKQPQPDSTTPGSTSQYPILRHMLKDSSSVRQKRSKPKLSHSIESILNRKEVPKTNVVMTLAEPLINYEFPSNRIPEGMEWKPATVDHDTITTTSCRFPPPAPSPSPSGIIGFSSSINHSLSSPFNLTPFPGQDLRNQVGSSWRLPPPWTCQDLRIFPLTTNYSGQQEQIWWSPYLIPPRPALLPGNYLYPHYANNGESVLPLL